MKHAKNSPKIPAAPWYRATIIIAREGFAKGERVIVRKSREGGYRILGVTRTIVVGDKHIASWVIGERRYGKPVMLNAAAQAKANDHLQVVFKAMWHHAPGLKVA